ncbi:hypothetical protein DL95DRAFT_480675 [Leptodontidium sp. 2 PMI_412]|nr:hypothetical protein DL95DRAFT_480675 [Leptodontidium sp. 2 PMI_412]
MHFDFIQYKDVREFIDPEANGDIRYDPFALSGNIFCNALYAGQSLKDRVTTDALLCENDPTVTARGRNSDDDEHVEADEDEGHYGKGSLFNEAQDSAKVQSEILTRLIEFMGNDTRWKQRFNHTDYGIFRNKRALELMGQTTSRTGQPTVHSVFEGIAAGAIQLVYARWQVYTSTNSGMGTGNDPLLELAYWIGPIAGQVPAASAFRDGAHAAANVIDKWIVIHLHFNNDRNMFKEVATGVLDSQGFPILMQMGGITQITMYHGQRLVQGRGSIGPGALRVFNSATAAVGNNLAVNARTITLKCTRQSRWFISPTNRPSVPPGTTYQALLVAWGAGLVSTGIFSTEAWSYIYPAVAAGAQ